MVDFELHRAVEELQQEVAAFKRTHDYLWEDLKKANIEIGKLHTEKFNMLICWGLSCVALSFIAVFF